MEIVQVLYFIPLGDLDCRRRKEKVRPAVEHVPELVIVYNRRRNSQEIQVFNRRKLLSSCTTRWGHIGTIRRGMILLYEHADSGM